MTSPDEASGAPTVSIVTPVYNGEKYLRECIESVLGQSFTNWEYLIADNCSQDSTVAIAEEYAKRDARIKVVKNADFLRIMPNWNRALRLISPESMFCKVVHADDVLFPDCLAEMVSVAMKDERIGIVGAYRKHGDTVNLDWLPKPDNVFPGKDVCRLYLLGKPDIFGSPSNIMMRSDIVRNRECFYDEEDVHADTSVCFDILKEYDFGYVHQALTSTRLHNESETSRAAMLNTHQAARFCRVVKFGPDFLGDEEYKIRYREVKTLYYRVFVGRSIRKLLLPSERPLRKEFFAYHRRVLHEVGETIEFRWVLSALWKLIRQKMMSFRTAS